MIKRILCGALLLALLLCACGAQAGVAVGDLVTFGSYEQDNVPDNGAEPIEWRVLTVEGDEAMMIAVYALDAKPYNEKAAKNIKWSTCTLRTWLNDTFLNTAFTQEEQAAIVTHELTNWKDVNTVDTVFLLDNDQAKSLFANHADRMTTPTAYAIANGAWQSAKYGPGNAQWWLRPHSWESNRRASYVAGSGGVMTCGGNSFGVVENARLSVRPVVYVKLEAIAQ